MKVRELRDSDLPMLRETYERTGFHQMPWPDLSKQLEVVVVVADDTDSPILASYARLVPEITLICAPGGSTHPLVKLKAIAMVHNVMEQRLKAKGFTEAICSVPPQLASYRRHLLRHFRWEESWPTLRIQGVGE